MQSLCVCAGAFKCTPVFDCVSAVHVCVCICMCPYVCCMRGGREAEHSRAERCSAGSRTAFLSCGNFPRDKRAGKGQQKREGGREG